MRALQTGSVASAAARSSTLGPGSTHAVSPHGWVATSATVQVSKWRKPVPSSSAARSIPVAASPVVGGHVYQHHGWVGLVAGEAHGVSPGGERGVGRDVREPGGLHQVTRRPGRKGLVDLKAPGRQRRLSLEQQQELAHSLESGPQLTRGPGAVRWRLADLCVLVERRFGIRYQERGMGKLVRALGFSRVSARPQHPKSDPEVQAQFKKNLPTGLPLPSATRVRANGSRSGFKTKAGSARRAS